MASDLYVLLGVDADASPEEIKSAYRSRVKEFHPDNYGSDTEPFRQAQEAYLVLTDPERRRGYDRALMDQKRRPASSSAWRPRAFRDAPDRIGRPGFGLRPIDFSLRDSPGDWHPSFAELFDRFWSNFTLMTRPKAEHIESLTVEIPISAEEAMIGGRAHISIPARARCPACHGHGAVGAYECWKCRGQGAITANYPLEISYPPGISSEHVVQIPLGQFGIENFYLAVRFRVTAEI